MKPNWNPQEQEIIELLGKLKTAGPEYPDDKLAKRRAAFIASMSAMAIGGAVGTKAAASYLGKLFKGVSLIEKVIIGIEMTAVAGLAAYVGVTAYVHREDLKNLFLPPSTPVLTTPLPALDVPPTSFLPTISATSTPTTMWTSTLLPGQEEQPQPTSPAETQPSQPQATEPPPIDTPGLHLGQTKTPKP